MTFTVTARGVIATRNLPHGTVGGKYTYKLDNEPEVEVTDPTAPVEFVNLAPGPHNFQLFRYDAAGVLRIGSASQQFTVPYPDVLVEVPVEVVISNRTS